MINFNQLTVIKEMIPEKFAVKEGNWPMTIIAVMWESDSSILIAANSGQTDMPEELRSIHLDKLQSHLIAPLAWGATGNTTIGERFGEWLKNYEWPPQDLIVFQDELATALAKLNGKQREIIKLAGGEAKEDNLCSVLVAGWLNAPFAFEIDDFGQITPINKEHNFSAIGSGGPHAKLIHAAYTIGPVTVNASALDKMGIILDIAAQKAHHCDPPIHIWRVTSNKIEKDLKYYGTRRD